MRHGRVAFRQSIEKWISAWPRGWHLFGEANTSTEGTPNLDSFGMPRDPIVMGTNGPTVPWRIGAICLGWTEWLKSAIMATYEHALEGHRGAVVPRQD
jgi:hypothetical protein